MALALQEQSKRNIKFLFFCLTKLGDNGNIKIGDNMRDKKGFTLVELLAVIVILGIIMVIATTSVIKNIKESKIKAKYMAAKDIVDIAEAYFEVETEGVTYYINKDTSDSYCNGAKESKIDCIVSAGNYEQSYGEITTMVVKVKYLISNGYLDSDATNPRTGENSWDFSSGSLDLDATVTYYSSTRSAQKDYNAIQGLESNTANSWGYLFEKGCYRYMTKFDEKNPCVKSSYTPQYSAGGALIRCVPNQ